MKIRPWRPGSIVIRLITGDLIPVHYLDAKKFKHDYKLGMIRASIEANQIIKDMMESTKT